MKQKLTFCLFFLMLVMPAFVRGTTLADDTVPVKTTVYQVKKKKETIISIAGRFKLNAQSISLLNDSMPVDKILKPGQTIIIPVTEVEVKLPEEKINRNLINQKVSESDTAGKVNLPNTTAIKPVAATAPAIDTDLIESKIMLADATLDLNRALLQGIQASLDSLNVKDKKLIDEKNISVTIHRMQRQRDKVMLTPVLLHMQDSLKAEIKKEELEKTTLESVLGKSGPLYANSDTAVTKKVVVPVSELKDTIAPPVIVQVTDTATKPVITTGPLKEIITPKEAIASDTLQRQVVLIKKDSTRQSETLPLADTTPIAGATAPPPITHWETAKAIYFNDDTTGENQSGDNMPVAGDAHNKDLAALANGGQPVMSDSSKVVRAQYFYTKALKASNEKSYTVAVGYLQSAISILPAYYDAWFALGENEMHLGFYTRALNEFAHCRVLDTSKASLYYKTGVAQLKLNQKAEALGNFNKSLKRDSNYIPAIISRAGIYAERNQLRAAIREYDRVIKIDPSYHTVYKSKAMAEYQLQTYAAAVDDFTRFLIFNETDGSVYYYRGMAKLKQNGLIDACTDLSVSAKLGNTLALKALQAHCK